MKEKFREHRFTAAKQDIIAKVNDEIEKQIRDGFTRFSLRQIYYQMVKANFIDNEPKAYKRLGNDVGNARMAGLIDWDVIEDRTRQCRNERRDEHGPMSVDIAWAVRREIEYCFETSTWANQPNYVECWIEKDALAAVLSSAIDKVDVPFFVCRGFSSHSAMKEAAKRFIRWRKEGKRCILLYCGDHDPSGVYMDEDIRKRMAEFGAEIELRRLALTLDQVEEYNLPPNPAKEDTDKRFPRYKRETGLSVCWELDALPPVVLRDLTINAVKEYFDQDIRDANLAEKEEHEKSVMAQYEPILKQIEELAG